MSASTHDTRAHSTARHKPLQNAVSTRPSPDGPNAALREDLELKLCGECSGPRVVHSGPSFRAKTIRLQKVRGSGLPRERGHRQTDLFVEFRSVESLFGPSPLRELRAAISPGGGECFRLKLNRPGGISRPRRYLLHPYYTPHGDRVGNTLLYRGGNVGPGGDCLFPRKRIASRKSDWVTRQKTVHRVSTAPPDGTAKHTSAL